MSARERLRAAALAALGGMDGMVVFDAPPARAALPHAVLDEPELRGWEAAGLACVEGRVTVAIHDAGERPVRLRALAQAAEDALGALVSLGGLGGPGGLGGDVGEGWRLVACRPVRARMARAGGADRWRWQGEFEVRMFRAHG